MKPMNSNIKIDAGWHGAYREKVVEQGFKYKQTNINTDYLIGQFIGDMQEVIPTENLSEKFVTIFDDQTR